MSLARLVNELQAQHNRHAAENDLARRTVHDLRHYLGVAHFRLEDFERRRPWWAALWFTIGALGASLAWLFV